MSDILEDDSLVIYKVKSSYKHGSTGYWIFFYFGVSWINFKIISVLVFGEFLISEIQIWF